ncbi:MnmC family methyltransferase [Membranihabitans marinus]|uniref:MnmC family methyltransferase n=1 Tax=Membranihabitans marinus TaxID=1227546 RepID=UPI001F2E160B|nr:MnmC family methyltransferase [Membranihabitans marinus]
MKSTQYQLQKIYGDFENHISDQGYHIIYYDAFAPEAQPDLWDETAMAHCYDLYDLHFMMTEKILKIFGVRRG